MQLLKTEAHRITLGRNKNGFDKLTCTSIELYEKKKNKEEIILETVCPMRTYIKKKE